MKRLAPILITLLYLAAAIWFQRDTFFITYPIATYEKMYSESQYVLGNASTRPMGDGDIYTYAGIRYLQGEDPTKINFEHPPFAKYLFGASYLLFGFPNLILVPLFLLAVFSFWKVASHILKSEWSKYLALFLFLGHSTVYKELGRTMLELPLTTLILVTTLLFSRFMGKPNLQSSIFLGVSGGLLLAVKYPIPLTILYLFLLFSFGIYQKTSRQLLLTSFVLMGIIYLCCYLGFFLNNQTIIDFLKFEWWRAHWFLGKTDSPHFLLLSVLFLGKYPRWWDPNGGYVLFPHWSIMWPASFLLFVVSWFQKIKSQLTILFPYKLWILVSFIILLIGVYEDRFLLPLIPGFALFGAEYIERKINEIIRI